MDLPRDRTLEIQVRELESPGSSRLGFDREIGLPVVNVSPGTKIITSEDIRRAEEEL